MATGLSLSDVVNVTTVLSPLAIPLRNFGAGLLVGSSDVINVTERIRSYSGLLGVGGDFGGTTPEYLGAVRFFAQSPQPSLLYIGRWAATATSGVLFGGVLSAAQQVLTNFTTITNGSVKFTVDGTLKSLTALNFSGALNLPAVAAIIQTAFAGAATCIWDNNNNRFVVESTTTGTSSSVSYATAGTSGTDISALLLMTSTYANAPVIGIAAETLAAGIQALINAQSDWYAAMILASMDASQAAAIAAAQVIEATQQTRIIGFTIQNSTVLNSQDTTNLAYQLKAANLTRSFTQFSSYDPYAICSFFGRASTINFTGSNTTLTMKFKVEPAVTADTLTETQAQSLIGFNCNVFVNYQGGAAIIQQGVMASGMFFDERQNMDWLQNYVQTALFNLLYTSTTKVPQTDAGMTRIQTVIENCMVQAITNGMLAPGVWNVGGFGTLNQGDYLTKGYYCYMGPINLQNQSDREARKSTLAQVACKFAGSVHSINAILNFNR